jgi:hypothetical protein
MNRLQKFVERGPYGDGLSRSAYLLRSNSLPQSGEGMTWRIDETFSVADELSDIRA